MSNETLADAATKAVTSPGYPLEAGWCQKFVRQVIQRALGSQYDAFHKASARASALAWLNSPFGARNTGQSLQVGDILYKTYLPHGHVGIYVGDNRVAENSSTKTGRVQGAKGYRTLAQYGGYDVVVRLPDPAQKPNGVIVGYYDGSHVIGTRLKAELRAGHNWAEVRSVLKAAGIEAIDGTWGDGTPALIRK